MPPEAPAIATVSPRRTRRRSRTIRCEDENGHITYSNQTCPTGTTHERNVEYRPAVEVPRDGSADKGAKPASAAKAGNVVPGDSVETKNPERAKELDSEKNKALVAHCDDLAHRIEFAQQDALTADTGERASKELNLHRLQEEQKADCAPKS